MEQSKQKFFWVVRDAHKGDIFDGSETKRYELLGLRREWRTRGWL